MIHSNDFKNKAEYRASFNRLSRLVFGIDFEAWYQKGCWDDRYICHSIVNDNQIISNVSVSKMDLVVNGVTKRAIQIGTVMTHPEYRGKGLSKQLMENVLETYENSCDLLFLFANTTVLDFYPKFGFAALPEFQFYVDITGQSGNEALLDRLNISRKEDWNLIIQMLHSRRPISQRLGVSNNLGLFNFYALNVYPECLYYSKADDAIIVFEHEGELLHIYDVVSSNPIDFSNLIFRISTEQTRKIRFHFTPDQLINKAYSLPSDDKEGVLFVKPLSVLGELQPFCIPTLAHA